MKYYKADDLYTLLFKRWLLENYPMASDVILHHLSFEPTGKIIAAIEMHFPDDIVFFNAHLYVDKEYQSISMYNSDKIGKYHGTW